MQSLSVPGGDKVKSFWERPEGTTGMIFGVLAIGAGIVGLNMALPFLIGLVQNLITLVGATLTLIPLGLLLFGVLWVLMDKRFWTLGWYMYKSAMRAITSVFVQIDPIGIMKSYVEDLRQKRAQMAEQIQNLKGQYRILQNKISRYKAEQETALQKAKLAHEEGQKAVFALEARRAGRREKSTLSLEELRNKMEMLLRMLKKYHEVAGVFIADLEDEVELREDERNMIRAGHGAMKRAMTILDGNDDKLELFNMAMESVTNDYGQKLGEIEFMLDMSSTFINSVDLDNMAFEAAALEKLQVWEEKADSLLLPPGEKQQLLAQSYSDSDVLDINAVEPEPETVPVERKSSRYAKMLSE